MSSNSIFIVVAYLRKLRLVIFSDWTELKKMFRDEYKTVPNMITTVRFVLLWLPGILLLVSSDKNYYLPASLIFAAVALTDNIDGRLARWLNQETRLGALMDSVVDKFLAVFNVSVMVIVEGFWLVRFLLVAIILVEILIFVSAVIAKHKGCELSVTKFGKFKSFVLCAVITVLMIPVMPEFIRATVTMVALVFCVIGLAGYYKKYFT